ncbi:MAG: PRTRC system protein C [Bacteroidetes bacterium 43-16]|nr:MAG: PRTRC system protein C [Bacteroidetes bacterium 43-16]
MLIANELRRVFLFKDKETEVRLPDPNSNYSPETVMDFYAATYDILTTAKLTGPVIKNDEMQYRFESVVGTKG